MSYDETKEAERKFVVKMGVWAAIVVMLASVVTLAGCPMYNVWQQGMSGKAEMAKAEQNRRIRVEEARASLDSAKLTAQAEVERAKGVAQANSIVADGLGGVEGYIRWRTIEMMENTNNKLVYVPTEAMLPITEAGRTP